MRMIRHMVEEFCRRQTITGELQFEGRFRVKSGRRHGDFPFL
jgi:hypothetical protein